MGNKNGIGTRYIARRSGTLGQPSSLDQFDQARRLALLEQTLKDIDQATVKTIRMSPTGLSGQYRDGKPLSIKLW